MKLKEAFAKDIFALTAEIFPPKGSDINTALQKVKEIKGVVHAINVTDNQRAVMRMNPIVLSHLALLEGVDSIYQMCCRDRNSLGLQSDILAAAALGISNILAITGDYPVKQGKMLAKPVYELDSVQLIKLIKTIEAGHDMHGNILTGQQHFNVGAVVNPNSEQIDLQILKLKKKVDAGATFIQTQVVYDIEGFKRFRDKTSNIKAKMLLGIFPLKSFETAKFMNEKVPGVKVGDKVMKKMADSIDSQKQG